MRIVGFPWGGVAAILSFVLVGGGGGSGSSGENTFPIVPDTVARASADPNVLQSANPAAARVTVTWGVPPGVSAGSVAQYHIFRENDLIGVAQPGLRTFIDWRGNPADIVYRVPDATGALTTANAVATLHEIGSSYHYSVRAIYRGSDGKYRQVFLPASGFATPIARPAVNGPTTDQNLNRIQVDFYTVQSANQYIFEFSASADFANKVVRGPFTVEPTPIVPSQSEVFDISSAFSSVPGGSVIHVRVGARSAVDTPGPVANDVTNGGNYVYSVQNRFFRKIAIPPPPPI